MFVAHLKSKLPTQIDGETWYDADPETYRDHRNALGAAISTIRRTAEATALRVLLTEVMKGTETPVLVLGDLNDGQHSNTINILTEQPNYLVGESRGGADIGLYTAQTLQEYRDTRDVYYTHVHQDLRESLDHVLVSEQFYDHSRQRQWLFDGLSINNDHLNDEDHRATGTGDHGVVKVGVPVETVRRLTGRPNLRPMRRLVALLAALTMLVATGAASAPAQARAKSPEGKYAQQAFTATNANRAHNGLKALKPSDCLQACGGPAGQGDGAARADVPPGPRRRDARVQAQHRG